MLSRPRAAPDVLVEEMSDELCLMRLDTEEVLVLNRTASDVWLLVSDGMDVVAVCESLATAYGTTPDEVAGQVGEVITMFEQRGFIIDSE